MNIKSLSNHELEKALKIKTSTERQLTVEIISLLEEVSSRRLYLQRGFGSIIEYCIKELGYSESSAYRRISAMRIIKELPKVKEALADGRLNLVNVARAQTHFQKEAKNKKALSGFEKSKVLETLENQSSRGAEKILLQLSPEILPKEKTREVSATHTQISLVFSEELMQKLFELKQLLSHKNPSPSTSELIELLANIALKKLKCTDVSVKDSSLKALSTNVTTVKDALPKARRATNAGEGVGETAQLFGGATKNFKRVYISTTLRRRIWHKANGKCQYQDAKSKRQCGSKFQLQIEHIHPVAKGGQNAEENLELICAQHNRLRAISKYGKSHMQNFLGNLHS